MSKKKTKEAPTVGLTEEEARAYREAESLIATSGFTVVVGGVAVKVPRLVELAGAEAVDAYVRHTLEHRGGAEE